MQMRKKLLIAGTAAVIGAGALGATGVATAQTNSTTGTSLVDKIASKFNLNKDEVQKVFDQDQTDRQAEGQAKFKDKLDQAVSNGKLTQDQADKIIAKMKELESQRQANREAMKDKTDDERRAAMKAERDALTQWAKDNNIPEDYLRGGFGGPGHGGPGGPPAGPSASDSNSNQ